MKIPVKRETLGTIAAWLIRTVGATMRFEIDDRCGLLRSEVEKPVIWAFWHNRMFVLPLLRIWHAHRRYGTVLTSASKDGEVIAAVMTSFGIRSVRGSSSRRGASAVLGLKQALEMGDDVAITPDGPRGPRYKLGPGAIFLAQQTGAAILPIHIEYSRAVRLKSWDQFMIPLPFSRVHVIFDNLILVPPEADAEAERARIEQLMHPKTE